MGQTIVFRGLPGERSSPAGVWADHTKRWSAPRAGVTLLEMVVVVAIVGLIVGISFPSISAGLDAVRMVSATDSVAAFLNSAVNRAQRRQEAVEVVIDPKENQLSAYSNDPSYARELKLPDGINIEGEARRIVLLPGGSVPGVGIQLVNKRGGRRVVKLDPMTGYPRVEGVNKS